MTTAELLNVGVSHHQAGRTAEAEECYLGVLAAEHKNTEAMRLLALLMVARGDFDAALNYATASVDLMPANGDYRHLLGRIQLDLGELDTAVENLRRAIADGATDQTSAHLDLALCEARRGAWDESLAASQHLLQSQPNNVYALRAAATALGSLDRTGDARDYFDRACAAEPSDIVAWEGASSTRRKLGDLAGAWRCIEQAAKLAPEDPDVRYMARVIRSEMTPAWHFNMMNDAPRNTAFRAVIERQVKPNHLVLEIGTGAGLLAMMAARTGARVITCEFNPAIAAVARKTIAANGLSNKITVIEKYSWDVKVGVDLPRAADVLIAEIFSAQVLSEDVIPSIEDAKARLLKPNGIVIPAQATMVGALVESTPLAQLTRVATVEGFDLSVFNGYTPPLMNLDVPNTQLNWLSEPADLFQFDFQNEGFFPPGDSTFAVEVTQSGLCQGVVQWLRLDLDETSVYENPPAGAKATRTPHWTPLLYPFVAPQKVTKGQQVTLRVVHDRKGARIDLVGIA